ncbi:MAG: hypothetical protein AAF919_12775 [Pseudomonadota bacterium]
MAVLVWIGAALTIAGIGLLIACIVIAARARKAGLEGAEMEARLRRLVPMNLGALAMSGIGLMMVAVGAILG